MEDKEGKVEARISEDLLIEQPLMFEDKPDRESHQVIASGKAWSYRVKYKLPVSDLTKPLD